MAALTFGLIGAALSVPLGWDGWVLILTLLVILLGAVATAVRRTRAILGALESR
jgi:hypothetical protein